MRCGAGSYIGAALDEAIGRNLRVLSGSERIYLDHAATTPVLPEARAAVARAFERWANPSSPHADGRVASQFVIYERQQIGGRGGFAAADGFQHLRDLGHAVTTTGISFAG